MGQFVVGVTGGIGSGKTTVTDFFVSKGIVVVDADIIAREVVASGTPALKAIQAYFGDDILLPSGELDRSALREQVFHDADKKTWLDKLLHPIIREQMQQQSRTADSIYSILSIPLLVENKLMSLVDRILVVDINEDLQLERAVARDGTCDIARNSDKSDKRSDIQNTQNTIKAIMQNQCTREQRLAVADDVVNNDKDIVHLHQQLMPLHRQYVSMANMYKK